MKTKNSFRIKLTKKERIIMGVISAALFGLISLRDFYTGDIMGGSLFAVCAIGFALAYYREKFTSMIIVVFGCCITLAPRLHNFPENLKGFKTYFVITGVFFLFIGVIHPIYNKLMLRKVIHSKREYE